MTISAHHNAVIAMSANISQASAPRGGMTGGPKFKLEASFEPKPPLKIDMAPADVQNWERQFKMVVRRHNLFSLEQKKDEYKFSDTLSRLDTLAKEADLTDMSKDSISSCELAEMTTSGPKC